LDAERLYAKKGRRGSLPGVRMRGKHGGGGDRRRGAAVAVVLRGGGAVVSEERRGGARDREEVLAHPL
jgi:hypothetical protein